MTTGKGFKDYSDSVKDEQSQKPKTIRKEFTTYWSQESVMPLEQMSLSRERFYDRSVYSESSKIRQTQMIRPDAINFNDLLVFTGRKTKVTIEIIE